MSLLEKLSFADIVYSNQFLLEVIPHRGVELSGWHMRELNQLIDQLKGPIGLLINRSHGFSFGFYSLQSIINNPRIVAIAFYAPERITYSCTEGDIGFILKKNKPLDIFTDKLVASLWLNMLRMKFVPEEDASACPSVSETEATMAVNKG